MTPDQLERLLNRLPDVKSTDELYDLELRLAPFDEEDAVGKRALYHLASARCQLARGPALPFERFTLTCPEPPVAQDRFEVRGRVGSRITRIAWVDGVLCGSLYVIAMLGGDAHAFPDAETARARIRVVFDEVFDEERSRAVA